MNDFMVNEIEIIAILLERFDHKDYERRFKYYSFFNSVSGKSHAVYGWEDVTVLCLF